jgi:hypothetical protein
MKKHTLTLDWDDENPLLDDIAILLFQTDTPGYLLVDDLNHLYRLAIARSGDLPLLETSWPFYTYYNHLSLLHYYIVEPPLQEPSPSNPSPSPLLSSVKILILRGEDASSVADSILSDFSTPPSPADPYNPSEQQRNDILLSYQQLLTSVSLYDPQPPSGLSRKAARERQELDTLLTTLLDYLDLNHL